MISHDGYGGLGEVAGVDLELWVLIIGENGKRRVPSASADLKNDLRTCVLSGHLGKNGKFLLKPFAVLEEVGCVVLVEQVPPLRGV